MPDIQEVNDTSENNDENSTNTSPNTTGTGCVYDKWGRTPDKSQICAIGIRSASADTQDGVVKCVFENKCAHCGQPALMWGWKWDSDAEKVQKFDGTAGTAEGHIYCVQSEGGCDADFSVEGNEHINGSTAKLTSVSGPTPSTEEEAQQLSNGQLACDGSSVGGSSTGGGSAVLIPDKTFYGLIKQILGAVDGTFTIANNMAYLLSFKDFYEYRNQFDEMIPKIERKDVLRDSLVKNWSNGGYYNTVEVTYAGGIIKYQNDVLVKQYGENTFYYEFPEDDEETAKAKADALLSAHIRDYSTDIQLSIFFNENITEGSWVKVHKSLTEISGKTLKEIQQEEIKKRGEVVSSKRKGLTIENITEKTITEDDITKTFQVITDEEGEEYEIEIEKTDYELFFVQSYTCRWDSHNSLIMDLELKYGPDTPEDPVNATVGVGGGAATGSVGGQSATINEFVKQCVGNNPKQDMATVQKLYDCLNQIVIYELYECSIYSTPDECYQYAGGGGKTPKGVGINCADTSRLVVACYKAAGFQCQVVSCDGHYWNEVMVNGQAQTVDCSSGTTGQHNSHPLGDRLLANVPKTGAHGDNPSC